MNLKWKNIQHKIQELDNAQKIVQQWKTRGQRCVFTNGCFDLIHYGHLHYLAQAAALGDRLIVALNSDSSVAGLKGKHRPIKDQKNRLHLMASLSFVDLVLCFDEETPLKLIQQLLPDVLVKGGDWSIESIVGHREVLDNGGDVQSLQFIEGYSTSLLEQKILDAKR